MTATHPGKRSPQEIKAELEWTNARLAQSVEAVAFHAGHLGDDVKDAAKDRLGDAKDQVLRTVVGRAAQARELVEHKRDELLAAWRERSATPR